MAEVETSQYIEIKRFTDDKIQAAVQEALRQLPPDRRIAIVAHADGAGASLTAVGKIGDHWTVSGLVSKPWNGPLVGEADVIASW